MGWYRISELFGDGCRCHAEGFGEGETGERKVALVQFTGGLKHTGDETGVQAHAFSGLLNQRQNIVLEKVHVLTSHHGVAKNGCQAPEPLHQL